MIRKAPLYVMLALGAVITTFPFFWMLGTGLKTYPEAVSPTLRFLPASPQWHNFADTFDAAPFAMYFANTFFVAALVTVSVVATSLLAGYAFARLRFPGRGVVFGAVLATMMVPFEVTLIPNFVLINRLGWYDTHLALIVPWCANAFSVFLMRQAFLGLPEDFFDAARIDGCGHFRFLAWVAAPLVRPMVVTVALFAFLGSYNSLVWPLVATGSERMRVVQVGLMVFSTGEGMRLNLLMCAAAIVILPTVALYFLAQRHFMEGSLGSGIKG
jgi:multiple sugar transport system permease protein